MYLEKFKAEFRFKVQFKINKAPIKGFCQLLAGINTLSTREIEKFNI